MIFNLCSVATLCVIYILFIYRYVTSLLQTNIVYVNTVAAKKESLFPNPDKFDPERWARDKPHPFSILLFGFGARSCYGKE